MGIYRYNEVRTMQVNHLAFVRFGVDDEVTKNLCEKIDEKVDAYANGDLSHAAEAVSLLWEASKSRGSSLASQSMSASVCPPPLPSSHH